MTGHAFQVLLSEDDIAQTFRTMRHHINQSGIIAFESRNPAINWSRLWNYTGPIVHKGVPLEVSRKFISMKDDLMTFRLSYQFPNELLTSTSMLKFPSSEKITRLASNAGLNVEKMLGNWKREPFDTKRSEEMIFICRPL